MVPFSSIVEEFDGRVQAIPRLGLGLSVDCYTPDLFDLMKALSIGGLKPAYLELFKSNAKTLEMVRRHFPDMPMTYHGEGLWVTQPDFPRSPCLEKDLAETIGQLGTIQSYWLNHECATKQMAGYSFGTYLPPLYTATSAGVTADNIVFVQQVLDRASRAASSASPLFLLEMAPLTYFSAGTIGIPEFFRIVTDRAACGLVLDIGHLWTLYRYTAVRRQERLEQFVGRFLEEFPLERVVEIHVAGLAEHEAGRTGEDPEMLPAWIDAHAAPIPSVLWAMLEQVLAHPGLVNLRAVALEVDTKAIPLIVEEFQGASRRFGEMIRGKMAQTVIPDGLESRESQASLDSSVPTATERKQLLDDYDRYARTVSGLMGPTGPEWQATRADGAGLDRYRRDYLPNEILNWGGELTQMFPDVCRALAQSGIALDEFVAWWVRTPRPVEQSYDFFLLKVDRFVRFVSERAPAARPLAEQEGTVLRRAYADANDLVQPGPMAELVR